MILTTEYTEYTETKPFFSSVYSVYSVVCDSYFLPIHELQADLS